MIAELGGSGASAAAAALQPLDDDELMSIEGGIMWMPVIAAASAGAAAGLVGVLVGVALYCLVN